MKNFNTEIYDDLNQENEAENKSNNDSIFAASLKIYSDTIAWNKFVQLDSLKRIRFA